MPWVSTTAFPHPLVNIQRSDLEPRLTNYLSYGLADVLTWQGKCTHSDCAQLMIGIGLGGVINNWRTETLNLKTLTLRSGPGILERLRVPWTYCWSPSLIPKPADWSTHIDVVRAFSQLELRADQFQVGFFFHDTGSSYKPPDDLKAFLEAGDPPVYIGFGSIRMSTFQS